MSSYAAFHQRSITDRDGFWAEQAKLIDWQQPYEKVCDYANPPFAKWFVGGKTNLCHNTVDRHLDRKSTRLNSSHNSESRMPSSA
jgi:propionyl-CoA synthetase